MQPQDPNTSSSSAGSLPALHPHLLLELPVGWNPLEESLAGSQWERRGCFLRTEFMDTQRQGQARGEFLSPAPAHGLILMGSFAAWSPPLGQICSLACCYSRAASSRGPMAVVGGSPTLSPLEPEGLMSLVVQQSMTSPGLPSLVSRDTEAGRNEISCVRPLSGKEQRRAHPRGALLTPAPWTSHILSPQSSEPCSRDLLGLEHAPSSVGSEWELS